jgi:excisionase family DNA binding protein
MAMTMTEQRPTFRTVAQAMAQLSCSRTTIRKLASEGKLTLVRFGGRTRITEESLNRFIENMLKQPIKSSPPIQPDEDEQ